MFKKVINWIIGLFKHKKKWDMIKSILGEEIDTDELVLIYPKEHIQEVYQAAVKEDIVLNRASNIARILIKLKAIQLLKGLPSHTFKNREYFNDVKKIVLVVTASMAEMHFFNSFFNDDKFIGYCYSNRIKKFLRVYDNKCYATIMSSNPNQTAGTVVKETPFMDDEDRRFYNEKGCKCDACHKLWKEKGLVHRSDCAVHNEPALPAGKCTCQM
jgi:hypothetical protein